MDMTVDIILDNLQEAFSLQFFGKRAKASFLPPVFYDKTTRLEKNRIYICWPGNMPNLNDLDSSNLLVCAESFPSMSYQFSGIPLIVIRDASMTAVVNELLCVFERFDRWEKALDEALANRADINEMLRLTAPLVTNGLIVLDRDLRVIASTDCVRTDSGKIEYRDMVPRNMTMSLEKTAYYRDELNENRGKRKPFYSREGYYTTNFFIDDEYFAAMALLPYVHPLRKSDPLVMKRLAKSVGAALEIHSQRALRASDPLESIMNRLLDGHSVFDMNLPSRENTSLHLSGTYVSMCIAGSEDSETVPFSYVRDKLASAFDGLTIIARDDYIVGLQDFSSLELDQSDYFEQIDGVLAGLSLRAGLSNRFDEMKDFPFHYSQSKVALELGMMKGVGVEKGADCHIRLFKDYALHHLLLNGPGFFPVRFVCPESLLVLMDYDSRSSVDYWGTLRCYLDNQMNIAETARVLYVHRNTLLRRIDRINVIFGDDLDDPQFRLWLAISMRLFDLER